MQRFVSRLVMIALLAVLSPAVVHAQATRTWVSGVGDDANPGSRTAPCKTFAGAIAKTAAGGEIDALDPGGFGALTITKSITIDGGAGQVASVLVAATNGFVINAGLNDVVIIRNMRFQGLGPGAVSPGLSGINVMQCGTVIIQNCEIDNFSVDGIHFDVGTTVGNMEVTNTRLVNCTHDGIFVHGALGIHCSANDSEAVKCGNAGYEVDTGVLTLTRDVVTNSNQGFLATTGGAIHATHCTNAGNTTATLANATSSVILNDCDIISNPTAIGTGAGATRSMGNNRFIGNTTMGTITSTIAQQ